MTNTKLSKRARGSLLGLACGDALGTTLEFRAPGTFTPIDDMIGGGPFGLKPGEWTDDTSMALCLAASLVESKGFDAKDQMQRYLRWFRAGYMSVKNHCFDIGNTTETALHTYEKTGNPYSGATDAFSAGNGGIMRLAPVVVFFHQDYERMLAAVADSSRTTHGTRTCIDAAYYFGTLIWGVLNGASKKEILGIRYTPKPGIWDAKPLIAEIDNIANGSFKHKYPPEIQGTGYVVKSLEAALWAFYHSNSFEEGALKAVNLGNDADTTGAVYGQLAGAYYGEDSIPSAWREKIAMKSLILDLADQLLQSGSMTIGAS